MQTYTLTLKAEFEKNANAKIAAEQKAYLKDNFDFYGIKTPERREITKPFLQKSYLPSKEEALNIVKELWQQPQRDFHYIGQELLFKYHKQLEKSDINLLEYMATHNAWWDTIDFIAAKIMGSYFKRFPEERAERTQKWINSGNFWLQRCAILFQLKYKEDLDTELLQKIILQLHTTKEFFLNKAIGWILRDYSKCNPEWVKNFVANHDDLHPLSKREALRLIK